MLTCSDPCTLSPGCFIVFLTNATAAKTRTRALNEIVMDVKLIPIGDRPKNKPVSPAKPKLKATDNVNSSTKSSLFLLINKILTKQYPGKNATNTKPKT